MNGYTVYYGENGSSYGLVFSKAGTTPVVVDYPAQNTVMLNGKNYVVHINSAGAIVLAIAAPVITVTFL